jgi:hypothetical protein
MVHGIARIPVFSGEFKNKTGRPDCHRINRKKDKKKPRIKKKHLMVQLSNLTQPKIKLKN